MLPHRPKHALGHRLNRLRKNRAKTFPEHQDDQCLIILFSLFIQCNRMFHRQFWSILTKLTNCRDNMGTWVGIWYILLRWVYLVPWEFFHGVQSVLMEERNARVNFTGGGTRDYQGIEIKEELIGRKELLFITVWQAPKPIRGITSSKCQSSVIPPRPILSL